ncbi:unnamed protein product [Oikopleura dioica]|uniref:Uncharacterized protein n=1 Tax=Oikopleura dioica TaxID=34765 RepID=E4XNW2_OIKDI|nr:unnamed protein product [Oikopleura dioica]
MAIKFGSKKGSSKSSLSSKKSKSGVGCCAPGGICAPGGGKKYIGKEKEETIEERNLSFQFQEHYGGDIHGQRRELAEILREIELIENSSTDDRGLMNIISEQNDADGSITKLNIELREICDKLTHVHSAIRSREKETFEVEREMIEIEKTEKERYDICWTHVHKYSKDSNEMMLQISYNEVIYSSLRQKIEDLKTELNTLIMSATSINIKISESYNIGLMKLSNELNQLYSRIKIAGDLKIQVENAKTKYEEEKRETQDLKNQIKKLEAQIRNTKQMKGQSFQEIRTAFESEIEELKKLQSGQKVSIEEKTTNIIK